MRTVLSAGLPHYGLRKWRPPWILFTMISCYLPMGAAFEILDLIMALLYFLNLIAMVGLWKDVKNCFDDYETQLKAGNDDPIFNWDAFRKSKGMAPMEWRENE